MAFPSTPSDRGDRSSLERYWLKRILECFGSLFDLAEMDEASIFPEGLEVLGIKGDEPHAKLAVYLHPLTFIDL